MAIDTLTIMTYTWRAMQVVFVLGVLGGLLYYYYVKKLYNTIFIIANKYEDMAADFIVDEGKLIDKTTNTYKLRQIGETFRLQSNAGQGKLRVKKKGLGGMSWSTKPGYTLMRAERNLYAPIEIADEKFTVLDPDLRSVGIDAMKETIKMTETKSAWAMLMDKYGSTMIVGLVAIMTILMLFYQGPKIVSAQGTVANTQLETELTRLDQLKEINKINRVDGFIEANTEDGGGGG